MADIHHTLANHVVITSTGCMEWTGWRTEDGYGRIGSGNKKKYMHRISYELTFGSIPDGLWVLHRCDNPPCLNPNHFFLGTLKDNFQDMYRKGRQRGPQGEKHNKCKLTAEQVLKIRDDERPLAAIEAEYGISNGTASKIRNRLIWKHLP